MASLLLVAGTLAVSAVTSDPAVGAEPPTGFVQPAVAIGVNPADPPAGGPGLDDYVASSGAAPAIVMWYQQWSEPLYWSRQLPAVDAVGAVPMITWEPAAGASADQPRYALRRIVDGDFDDYIRESAQSAAAYGKPMLIRFAHEMNGDWYSWGDGVNGNTRGDYVAAWRHVVTIFREQDASNVRWVWSPNAVQAGGAHVAPFADDYPGDDWVDWVALDGYDYPAVGRRTLADVFGPSYDDLRRLTRKPVMIGETATAEDADKAEWITDGFLRELQARMPEVRAVVWFDRDKEYDWRLAATPASLSAWRSVVSTPQFQPSYPVADPPPTAAIDVAGARGTAMTFTADAAEDARSLSYRWDFGDGSPSLDATETTAAHRFPAAGTYRVRLQALTTSGVPSTIAERTVSVDGDPAPTQTQTPMPTPTPTQEPVATASPSPAPPASTSPAPIFETPSPGLSPLPPTAISPTPAPAAAKPVGGDLGCLRFRARARGRVMRLAVRCSHPLTVRLRLTGTHGRTCRVVIRRQRASVCTLAIGRHQKRVRLRAESGQALRRVVVRVSRR